MACINPDGTLTVVAAAVLGSLERGAPMPAAAIAVAAGLPLYRVRASLRETAAAGLVETVPGLSAPGGDGYGLTDLGHEVLALTRETATAPNAGDHALSLQS